MFCIYPRLTFSNLTDHIGSDTALLRSTDTISDLQQRRKNRERNNTSVGHSCEDLSE